MHVVAFLVALLASQFSIDELAEKVNSEQDIVNLVQQLGGLSDDQIQALTGRLHAKEKDTEETRDVFEKVLESLGGTDFSSEKVMDQVTGLGNMKVKDIKAVLSVPRVLSAAQSVGIDEELIKETLNTIGISPRDAYAKLRSVLDGAKSALTGLEDDQSIATAISQVASTFDPTAINDLIKGEKMSDMEALLSQFTNKLDPELKKQFGAEDVTSWISKFTEKLDPTLMEEVGKGDYKSALAKLIGSVDPKLVDKLETGDYQSLLSDMFSNFDPKILDNLGFGEVSPLISELRKEFDPKILTQLSKGDTSGLMKLARKNPAILTAMMELMQGGGLNSMDPGTRLRMMQQGMGGLNPAMMGQMMELLNSGKEARQIVEELGLGKLDTDPKEAERQAQAMVAQMSRAMSMIGAGMGTTILPDQVLWVIVLLLFVVFALCITKLIQMRSGRFKKREKKEKKGKKDQRSSKKD